MATLGQRLQLKNAHLKMLSAVSEVNSLGKLPSEAGVVALLRGEEVAKEYCDLISFDSLRSLSKRGAKSMINLLLKRGYLSRTYSTEGDCFYLSLTGEGQAIADAYLANPRKRSLTSKARAPLFIDKESLR